MKKALLLALLALGSTLTAQQKLPSSEETIDVSIVNVDVFVTDKRGRRVTGLTADDFEIRENGRVQPVTNFAEYRRDSKDAATQAPPAKRTILLFIERTSLPPFHAKPLFAALRRTVREVVRPGDSAAVVFWDRVSAYTLQDFTDEVPKLEAALIEIEKQTGPGARAFDPLRSREFARSFYDNLPPQLGGRKIVQTFDLFELQADAHFSMFRYEKKAEELVAMMRSMSEADGRKILIFATDDFGLSPVTYPTGYSAVASGDLETKAIREEVARTANEHNITIYPVYPPGLEWRSPVDASVNRDNIFAVNQNDTLRNAHDFEVLVNQTRALDELAKETGGLTAAGSKDIVSLLPRVAEDLTSYYSLAYRTPATGTTKSRDITVRTKNRDLVVRSRAEYVEKTDVTRMQDRVIANLYRPDGKGTIRLQVELGTIDRAGRAKWSVPVRIRIPIDSLSVGRDDRGTFGVYIATGGLLGIMSDVDRRTQAFSFADIAPGQKHFEYEFTLTFNGATSLVSIGVLDERSKDFGLHMVELPAYRKEQAGEVPRSSSEVLEVPREAQLLSYSAIQLFSKTRPTTRSVR
jgi:VWFA-related protein